MSYEKTEAKLRALAAQREAERFRCCTTPGCRLEDGHAGLHRFVPEVDRLRARVAELEAALASRSSPSPSPRPDAREDADMKRIEGLVDALEVAAMEWAHPTHETARRQPFARHEALLAARSALLDAIRGSGDRDPAPKGIRRCPDCGSTYFNRDGAKALDEARSEGRREGIDEAIRAGDAVMRKECPNDRRAWPSAAVVWNDIVTALRALAGSDSQTTKTKGD